MSSLLFYILRGRITPLLLFSAGMNKDMLICSSFKVATLNAFLCYCLSGRFVDVQKSLLRINYITLSTAVLYRFNKAEKQAWKSYQCFSDISCMIDELTFFYVIYQTSKNGPLAKVFEIIIYISAYIMPTHWLITIRYCKS